jgi:hypothetical protein
MSFLQQQDMAAFSPMWIAAALAALAIGYGAGIVHFRTLKSVARRFVAGDLTAVALQIARLAALGLLLYLFARLGAHVLIAGAAGILLARRRVLSRTEAEQ